MTIQEADRQLLSILQQLYDGREAKNIADLVMENLTGRTKIDRLLNKQGALSEETEKRFQHYLTGLSNGMPVQYVIEQAWFVGLPFFVNENVLIPRPETEELVAWVVEEINKSNLTDDLSHPRRLLDVGTGSGCISVALKKRIPELEVFSCDVSIGALDVARRNANTLEVPVSFLHIDFLNKESRRLLPAADILISNPPYIPLAEKHHLAKNVTDFEPHTALFVPDRDPLLFYQALIDYMFEHENRVHVFAEIHEDFGGEVLELFTRAELTGIELRKDMQGKDRMISARR